MLRLRRASSSSWIIPLVALLRRVRPTGAGAEAGTGPQLPEVAARKSSVRAARGRLARRTGRRGERAAAKALRAMGWRVLGRNVRTPRGEIDLVAIEGETVALVEVKAKRAGGAPLSDRVDHRKRRRLLSAWSSIARGRGLAGRPWRFDVVEVDASTSPPTVVLRRGAFRAGR